MGSLIGQRVSVDFGMTIPPKTKRWFLTRQCTVAGATGPVNLFSTGFHAHLLGKEMYLDLWRDGVRTQIRDERLWHFDDQMGLGFRGGGDPAGRHLEGIVLQNGDVIESTCVMDSRVGGVRIDSL